MGRCLLTGALLLGLSPWLIGPAFGQDKADAQKTHVKKGEVKKGDVKKGKLQKSEVKKGELKKGKVNKKADLKKPGGAKKGLIKKGDGKPQQAKKRLIKKGEVKKGEIKKGKVKGALKKGKASKSPKHHPTLGKAKHGKGPVVKAHVRKHPPMARKAKGAKAKCPMAAVRAGKRAKGGMPAWHGKMAGKGPHARAWQGHRAPWGQRGPAWAGHKKPGKGKQAWAGRKPGFGKPTLPGKAFPGHKGPWGPPQAQHRPGGKGLPWGGPFGPGMKGQGFPFGVPGVRPPMRPFSGKPPIAGKGAAAGVPQRPLAGLIDRFDKNKDGKVTKDEAPAQAWERLEKAGAVKNGAVTRESLQALAPKMPQQLQKKPEERARPAKPDGSPSQRPWGGGQPPNAPQLFERLDKNKDGKLSKDEIPAPMWERLEKAGAVKDGAVSKEGLESSLKNMREEMQKRMQERGGPGARHRGPPGAKPEV